MEQGSTEYKIISGDQKKCEVAQIRDGHVVRTLSVRRGAKFGGEQWSYYIAASGKSERLVRGTTPENAVMNYSLRD